MLFCCKNLPVLLWGPLFVGAPVRPLNMPKSASANEPPGDTAVCCMLDVQIVGLESEDVSKFKVMLNGMLRCPVTIEALSHYVRSDEVVGKLDVFWGRNSFRENVIKSKVKRDKSLGDMTVFSLL